jgi:UDP-N-acetylglucosamine--N-acetylmuramyl-(pentapeptide) pyrophosphoryl-undecaprenol N-acetylglucosamine transferase
VFAGGGTGGHLFPGLAIAEAFQAQAADSRPLFVTTGRPVEEHVLAQETYETHRILAAGFKGLGLGGKIKSLVLVPLGGMAALRLLLRVKPHVVIGMGGYSAAPVILAAWILRIPCAIHEQNRIAGMTNRLLAPFVDRIYLSFPDTEIAGGREKIRCTGNPVRSSIAGRAQAPGSRGEGRKFTVLVAGGSQGAHALNTKMLDALSHLAAPHLYRFLHQSGEADLETVRAGYEKAGVEAEVRAFFNDMGDTYAAADLVICRAGATTVAEVASAGLPAVFIPYPHAADNHQYHNAKSLEEAGAAEMIDQESAAGELLAGRIQYYRENEGVRRQMQERAETFSSRQAASAIVADLRRLREERRSMRKKTGKTAENG